MNSLLRGSKGEVFVRSNDEDDEGVYQKVDDEDRKGPACSVDPPSLSVLNETRNYALLPLAEGVVGLRNARSAYAPSPAVTRSLARPCVIFFSASASSLLPAIGPGVRGARGAVLSG